MMGSTLIATHALRFVLRDRTVALLGVLFVVLVLISAWLGWQATATVNHIYVDAAAFLAQAGQPVPDNPVTAISPLSLLRNLSVYVVLIGALAAIVIGHGLIALDRKAGVLPLIGVRPLSRSAFVQGKIAALIVLVTALIALAALASVVTLMLIPALVITPLQWAQLVGFFAISGLYMLIFGLLGLACGAFARSESVGLLIPVTIWLTLTFIFPQLTANLNPTAAINPIAALAPPPDTAFFHATGQWLGSVSLVDAYKFAAARLLDLLPPGGGSPALLPPLVVVALALMATLLAAIRGLTLLPMTKDDDNA
jgi:ABC-type transport system involved in multi-copper enzyme maturation permease subunit